MFYIIKKGAEYYQDYQTKFWSGRYIPTLFYIVAEYENGGVKILGEGYGLSDNYGNGGIYIDKKNLVEVVVESH